MKPAVTEARLFIVNDKPSICDLLASSLRFAGYKVFNAGDDAEALRLTTTEKPDLVTLDATLPDMDDFTVARKLRAIRIDMSILFLIAEDDMHDRVEGLRADGDDYVAKSSGLEEVMARIDAVLRHIERGPLE